MPEYSTIFDVSKGGFKYGWVFIPALAVAILDVVIFISWKKGKLRDWPKLHYFILAVILLFASSIAGMAMMWSLVSYQNLKDAYLRGKSKYIEGAIKNFRAQPIDGKDDENFTVANHKFRYCSMVMTAGFNDTSYGGSVLRDGASVRIWYYDGQIARLDVDRSANSGDESKN